MGGGVKNGELLRLAALNGYDALISADKNISHQQNERSLPISIVVLHVYQLRIDALAPLIPKALEQLSLVSTPSFIKIE
jgi:hypothetical protein